MNKGKETGDQVRPRNGEMSGTRTGETAQRARSFFERASERVRDAAREIGQRARHMVRDDHEHDAMRSDTRDRDYGRHMSARDQSSGGREPQRYGMEQSRSYAPQHYQGRDRGYREVRMYGGREQSGREYMGGQQYSSGGYDRDRDYGRDFGGREDHGQRDHGQKDYGRQDYGRQDFRERDDRTVRGNFGGGYGMREENRNFGNDWGNDRSHGRSYRDRDDHHEYDENRSSRGRW